MPPQAPIALRVTAASNGFQCAVEVIPVPDPVSSPDSAETRSFVLHPRLVRLDPVRGQATHDPSLPDLPPLLEGDVLFASSGEGIMADGHAHGDPLVIALCDVAIVGNARDLLMAETILAAQVDRSRAGPFRSADEIAHGCGRDRALRQGSECIAIVPTGRKGPFGGNLVAHRGVLFHEMCRLDGSVMDDLGMEVPEVPGIWLLRSCAYWSDGAGSLSENAPEGGIGYARPEPVSLADLARFGLTPDALVDAVQETLGQMDEETSYGTGDKVKRDALSIETGRKALLEAMAGLGIEMPETLAMEITETGADPMAQDSSWIDDASRDELERLFIWVKPNASVLPPPSRRDYPSVLMLELPISAYGDEEMRSLARLSRHLTASSDVQSDRAHGRLSLLRREGDDWIADRVSWRGGGRRLASLAQATEVLMSGIESEPDLIRPWLDAFDAENGHPPAAPAP